MNSPRLRALAHPIPLALLLGFFTAIPVINAGVLSLQVLFNAVPADSLRLMVAPTALFLHALAGATFGLTGPLQFTRALRGRYDRLHRMAGRAFVVSGLWLGLSGLMLLARVESVSTALLDTARGLAGAALLVALTQGMRAIRAQNFVAHRAWMIRAYAIGMGSGTVALVFLPVYLITGAPPSGLGADFVVTTCWAFSILLAERIVRQRWPFA
jgi:uncharacterized membrane protein